MNINETNKSKKAAKKLAEELQALSGENRKLEEMIRGSHEEIEDKEGDMVVITASSDVADLVHDAQAIFISRRRARTPPTLRA